MLQAFVILFALAIAACVSAASEPREAPSLVAQRLPLAPGARPDERVGELIFRGALHLTSDDRRFGGLSGLDVSPQGHAIAVSDNGYFVEFDLSESRDGELIGARNLKIEQMRDEKGRPLARSRDRDAEEIVVVPGGERLVVFERNVRIGVFPADSAVAERFIPLPNLAPPTNRAIEAMTRLPDGRLLLINEGDGEAEGVRYGWLGQPGDWRKLSYVPDNNEDVTGAALLPNGDLLVLERFFAALLGFESRLKRVPAAAIRAGGRLEGRTILRLAAPSLADNFEGVAVRSAAGRTSIYLVSDDNYFMLQRTLLLKFDLAGE